MSLTELPTCARSCAERGLLRCQLDQPNCVCISASWFNVYRPCLLDACPQDELKASLDITLDACSAVYENANGVYLRDFEEAINEELIRATTSSSTTTPPPTSPPSDSPTTELSPTTEPESSGSSLSPGAIAGIALGSAALVLITVLIIFLLHRRKKRKSSLFKQPSTNPQFGDKWVPASPISPTQPYSPTAVGKQQPRYSGSTIGPGEGPAVHTVSGPQELPATSIIAEVEDPQATALAAEHEREANGSKPQKSRSQNSGNAV